jgi:hypothetical protein
VRLLRRVRHPDTGHEKAAPDEGVGGLQMSNTSWAHTLAPILDMKLVTHEVGRANWWIPSKDVVRGPNVRHLEGEIHLSPDLQPSCDFPLFHIEVLTSCFFIHMN